MDVNDQRRIVDVAACLVLLPLAVPLCLVLFLIISLDSRGSPLFVQERLGRDRRPFLMFKLRTMFLDSEHVPSHHANPMQITRVGKVLRKLKLDELPQLLNVLTGAMSLIGPRPCLPTQAELIEARYERGVFNFRPGVTGPAQIAGVDMSEPVRLASIEHDYFYTATLRSDFEILARTLFGFGSGDAVLQASETGSGSP